MLPRAAGRGAPEARPRQPQNGVSHDAERLRRLQLVTDAALAHLELDDLLSTLLVRVRDALAVDSCAVLLLDELGDDLVVCAAVGLEEAVERRIRIPFGKGFAGRVAAESRPIVVEDVQDFEILNPVLREKGVQTLVGVPLVAEGRTIGVLHVGTLTRREFLTADIELLQAAGDRAALGIAHARVFDRERRARQTLERVQAIADVALTYLALDELLGELLTRIREILHADTSAILLLDRTGDELVAHAAVGLEEEVERGVRIPVGRGFAGRIAAEQRPIVLDDVDHADVLNPVLREKGVKTLLGVPLVAAGRPIGVLHVGTLVPRRFTPDDVELLQLAAARVALAIERARLHEEAVRVERLKANFVAVASHELRTPAAAVYGILATLRERAEVLGEETRAQLEETLWEQAVRLCRLIEQLLDLSRLDAASVRIEPERFELAPFLTELATAAVGDDAADVLVDVPDGLEVVADRGAVERVVSNLVANACRYGRPPVVVTGEQRDRDVRIAVEDEGAGVADELVPRLFERFERGGEGTGSGLGLAIAKSYARAHGGDLRYERSGRGARFELVLPRD